MIFLNIFMVLNIKIFIIVNYLKLLGRKITVELSIRKGLYKGFPRFLS
ncbi:hypothetical protein Vdis_1724 [Vulcanisaeta distributa DSM 14429]|uniref:Uncharacterized protein n=1 Tax=Vulcanisaeta distributa (strain DSM 14429 / JCM 11212 / NBRC 100878 / IC-017) TaxID=572478 RepID=E1QUA4_VULDI|nr:hypothetical protein Vdis_1724 [Vulcanisaeta distributa DSM 14429]